MTGRQDGFTDRPWCCFVQIDRLPGIMTMDALCRHMNFGPSGKADKQWSFFLQKTDRLTDRETDILGDRDVVGWSRIDRQSGRQWSWLVQRDSWMYKWGKWVSKGLQLRPLPGSTCSPPPPPLLRPRPLFRGEGPALLKGVEGTLKGCTSRSVVGEWNIWKQAKCLLAALCIWAVYIFEQTKFRGLVYISL